MLSITALVLSLLTAAPVDQPSHLVISPCRVGEHQQFETVSCDIELHNSGDHPIAISKGEAKFAWDSIESGTTVPPFGTTYLKATVDLRDGIGFVKHSFRFQTSESGRNRIRGASVTAYVSSILDEAAPLIDFGPVKLSASLPVKSIELHSREVADFKLLSIIDKPAWVDARVGEDGRSVTATLLKDAPWGIQHGKIKLKTNAPQQPQVWVTVDANVIGEIAPGGNPFAFGLLRTNDKHEFLLRLTSESGKAFKTRNARMEGVKGKVSVLDCKPAAAGCKMLRITVANDQTNGRLQGKIFVDLPEFEQTLPIDVVGMLLPPDFVVHDWNKELEKSGKATSAVPGVELGAADKVDLKQAIEQKVRAVDSAPPPGNGPLLKWAVTNEQSVYAYIIYRADAEAGPFLRINKELIRAADDEGNAYGSYQWRDNSAIPGNAYWYEIGTVNGVGEKKPLSKPQKVVAK
ncbi:hypothetical protein [Dokdonella sp.]|uniref:hypothetical protein n=1 Tax=Dokdonella sp. TaxID=2291710 RepID=UPI0025C1BA6E|nr:hypothetical protein [Dokdonella sp.]MBX3690134.1 hypothetical protein [Dokdonella sp.]